MTTYIEYGVTLTDGQKSKLASALLRANVGKYRESQISSKNSNFG